MREGKASLQQREKPDLPSLASSPLISGQQMRQGNNNNSSSSSSNNTDINDRNAATRKDVSSAAENAIGVNKNRIELGTQTDVSCNGDEVSETSNTTNSKNEIKGNAMYFVDGKLVDVDENLIQLCNRCSSVLLHHSRQST